VDEKRLIEKAVAGDQSAQTKLVLAYQDKVFNLALRMTRDYEDAEDVMQETFLTALKKLNTFEGRSQFFTWLYRIAINISLQKLRDKKRSDEMISISDPDFESIHGEKISDWPKDARELVHNQEFREILDSALKKLPPHYRSVFILRDLEGLSTSETQKLLDLSESNVKVRLMRARVFLREELKAYFGKAYVNEAYQS
jgi:RNA polymerase sigma-70 factor, ECF subfamily